MYNLSLLCVLCPDCGRLVGGAAGRPGQLQHHGQRAQAVVLRHEGCGWKMAEALHQTTQCSQTDA